MKLLLIFILLNITNVILQTVKSIATVKCGKWGAAFINAVAFGLYTIVVVYLNCELPLWLKALIVAICNLIGVYVVKALEEKARKDKIWKIEGVFPAETWAELEKELDYSDFQYNIAPIFNKNKMTYIFYAYSQNDTIKIHQLFDKYNIKKYFISETKEF